MNEIFQYTTKYNESIKPGMDQTQTVKQQTRKTTTKTKKEKTKTK